MAIRKTLSAFGNSLALVIEKPVLELLGIDRTTLLEISTDGRRLVVEVAGVEPEHSSATSERREAPRPSADHRVVRADPTMGSYAPARLIDEACRISILTKTNPKQPGSASRARFDLYRDGMTVGDAYDAGVRREDVRWDLAHGFIELHRE
jgi:antitoxin component of MazEF toxin-antitoxin module